MEIVFLREVLYSEIWSTPISTLCQKYQLSDNGLRKVCKALSIPLPARGYWAKVAAGHAVEMEPLPATTGSTTFTSRIASPPPAKQSPQLDKLATRISFEKEPANKIVVPSALGRPHELVASASRSIAKFRGILKKSRAAAAQQRRRPNANETQVISAMHWYAHERRGLLLDPIDALLPMRVSLESVDRALRIWNAVIKAALARGMKADLNSNRLTLSMDGEAVDLRMSEHVLKEEKKPREWYAYQPRQPTGELRIFVCSQGETKFSDGTKGLLENQLNAIFCTVYRSFAALKVWHAKLLEDEQLAGAVREKREVERGAREEAQRLLEEQKRREHDLVDQAQAWRQAHQIRAYVASLQAASAAGLPMKRDFIEWTTWANAVADSLDPSGNWSDDCERKSF